MITKEMQEVIDKFEKMKPGTLREVGLQIDNLGLVIKKIGDGLYRTVYRIEGLPLVVKVPNHTGASPRKHAIAEYKTIRRIMRYRKYGVLKPYMPKVYYFDEKSGVMLVHFYAKISPKYKSLVANLLDQIVRLVWPYASNTGVDVHGANVGLDEDGDPILIDLGYFHPIGKWGV